MYDGSEFCGWQRQTNQITIQETIEQAIFKITKENVILTGSGRTDSSVHAYGQIANFFTESTIPTDRIVKAINSNMVTSIRILEAEEVDLKFNSRFSSKKKTYLYQIYNNSISNPFYDRYSFHIPYNLNIDLMDKALKTLHGEHDFRAFMAANSGAKTTIREIYDTSINKEDSLIKIELTGNGFLYNMVRIIIGTLVQVGGLRKNTDVFLKAFKSLQRSDLGMTAPAKGLFLKNVKYDNN